MVQKGIGSKVLSICHKEVPKYWKKQYGDKLVLLTTMIGEGYKGTCYKAAGWQFIGKTKGYGGKRLIKRTGKIGRTKEMKGNMFEFEEPNEAKAKLIFVKPLHRYWKKELLKV